MVSEFPGTFLLGFYEDSGTVFFGLFEDVGRARLSETTIVL